VILKVPEYKNNTGYICHKKLGDRSYPRSMLNITLPCSPDIVVYQNHYKSYYIFKMATYIIML
jgi:hypothetical protein